MAACVMGRKNMVALLVRRGAAINYIVKKRSVKNGVALASPYPGIVHWLLVSRWTDQGKLCDSDAILERKTS